VHLTVVFSKFVVQLKKMVNKPAPISEPIVSMDDVKVLFKIFRKNWYFLIFLPPFFAVLAYLYTYRQTTVYAASTRVLLKSNEIYDYQQRIYSNIGYYGYYGDVTNQIRILQSYDLIESTLDKLNFEVSYFIVGKLKTTEMYNNVPFMVQINPMRQDLYDVMIDFEFIDIDTYKISYTLGDKDFSFKHKFGQEEVTNHYKIVTHKREQMFNDALLESYKRINYQIKVNSKPTLIAKIKSGMRVENLEYTSILDIIVEDEIPERAKTFLDTLSRVYIIYSLQSEFDINEKTAEYIDRQLLEVTQVLDTIESELENYKSKKAILDLSKESEQYFDEYVDKETQMKRVELMLQSIDDLEEYILNLGEANLLPPNLYMLEDDVYLSHSVKKVYELQLEKYEHLNSRNPIHSSIQNKLETLDRLKKDILTYLINSRKAATQKKRDLLKQREFYESKIKLLPKSERDLLAIQRKQTVNQTLYVFLLEKKANTRIARAGILPQTKVIEKARSIGPVRPDKRRTMIFFVLGGVILASLIAFVRFVFFERIESVRELSSITQLPVLGGIPSDPNILNVPIVVNQSSKSNSTESFRHLRTNLNYLSPETNHKIVLISSIHPGEGKTYVSSNLSAIISKAHKRVLLIDFDLHKPKVHKMFNISRDKGVSTFLVGQDEIPNIISKNVVEGLDVMPAGPVPPNASELILSDKVLKILEYGRENYDLVVLDTPPIGLISDAVVLLKQADAGIFVMNVKFAKKQGVRFLEEVIEKNNLKNVGITLNNVTTQRWKYYSKYGYGYGYSYSYGYGYGYGYGEDDKK
jgi:tyrosine-protein kinase Etk/Wzc